MLTPILSLELKHTSALEKPQLHCNNYSNAHTNALTPTQTHFRNTSTYQKTPNSIAINI